MASLTIQVHEFEPPLYPKVAGAKRNYPGEAEGAYLVSHLNGLSRVRKKSFWLPALEALQQLEIGRKKFISQALQNLDDRKRAASRVADLYFDKALNAEAKLKRKIDRGGSASLTNEGLVIPPKSAEGKAALAALLLHRKWRLLRLRQCLNCSDWFYARFERQLFCSDRQKNCQWNYYHTPEWRKRNRKRNLEHQRAYRERNPGRGRT